MPEWFEVWGQDYCCKKSSWTICYDDLWRRLPASLQVISLSWAYMVENHIYTPLSTHLNRFLYDKSQSHKKQFYRYKSSQGPEFWFIVDPIDESLMKMRWWENWPIRNNAQQLLITWREVTKNRTNKFIHDDAFIGVFLVSTHACACIHSRVWETRRPYIQCVVERGAYGVTKHDFLYSFSHSAPHNGDCGLGKKIVQILNKTWI
jgi:hypothetical protein